MLQYLCNETYAMNILIVGGGGREHTFAWKIAQSPLCDRILLLPETQEQQPSQPT